MALTKTGTSRVYLVNSDHGIHIMIFLLMGHIYYWSQLRCYDKRMARLITCLLRSYVRGSYGIGGESWAGESPISSYVSFFLLPTIQILGKDQLRDIFWLYLGGVLQYLWSLSHCNYSYPVLYGYMLIYSGIKLEARRLRTPKSELSPITFLL